MLGGRARCLRKRYHENVDECGISAGGNVGQRLIQRGFYGCLQRREHAGSRPIHQPADWLGENRRLGCLGRR